LGCGNGSLLVHMVGWSPSYLEGVDLGTSVQSARTNLGQTEFSDWCVKQGDMTEYQSDGFDIVYSIGVLHHLKEPKRGLDAVVRNVRHGGRFHCWVYAHEGNALIILLIDPIRKLVSHLPWWLTKYFIATPLAIPFYFYAKFLHLFGREDIFGGLPLYEYSLWIAKREFAFFRHVAFDQLVTPQTTYINRATIETWLASYKEIVPTSIYITMRNANSWKFGGQIRATRFEPVIPRSFLRG
jgi:SAM-dependent methyltransferase